MRRLIARMRMAGSESGDPGRTDRRRRWSRPRHTTVVAYLALFIALGGTATAVTRLVITDQSQVGDNTIVSRAITDGTIQTADLGPYAVTAANIFPNTIQSANIATPGVRGTNIYDNAVTTSKLTDGAVTTSKLASGSVTTSQLANGAVGTSQLAQGAVDKSRLGYGSVGANAIGLNFVEHTGLCTYKGTGPHSCTLFCGDHETYVSSGFDLEPTHGSLDLSDVFPHDSGVTTVPPDGAVFTVQAQTDSSLFATADGSFEVRVYCLKP